MLTKGEKLDDPNEVVDCMNEHLCTVGERMANECPESSKDPLDYITCDIKQSTNFSPTSKDEVSKLIKSLKNNKACGYDLITNRMLKETQKVITPYLTTLFNKCIALGDFPTTYKVAKVIPLYKGEDRENPTSYRRLLPLVE